MTTKTGTYPLRLPRSVKAEVERRAKADGIPHRTAAMAIGVEKVRAAKTVRGLFP